MAGKQVAGDGVPPNLAGMSKNQLYDVMSQMKTLMEHNREQAKQILVQNPVLSKALFQAQIMLGMVQSPQAVSTVSPSASQNSQPSSISNKESNVRASSQFPAQTGQSQRNQQPPQIITSIPEPQPIPPPSTLPHSIPSHPVQPIQQQPKGQFGAQSTPMAIPQSTPVPNLPLHTVSQPPSHHQPAMPSPSSQSQQQPLQNHYMPLQPPLPPQPRPQMPAFPHQIRPQTGQSMAFQHSSGPQMHHSQHSYHSAAKPPAGLGPSFPHGQPPLPNQPLPPSIYQAGGSHLGMEFNQGGSSKQTDRGGSHWTPGPPENTMSTQLPGTPGPQSYASQMSPGHQPPLAPPLTPELEKQLLQQVMTLTPEQINMLPPEQRNQILQLQQMLRQ